MNQVGDSILSYEGKMSFKQEGGIYRLPGAEGQEC